MTALTASTGVLAAPANGAAAAPPAEMAAPLEFVEASAAPHLTGVPVDAVAGAESAILGSGLPEGPAKDGYRSDLERSWFGGGADLKGRATAARNRALHLGASSAAGPALALLTPEAGLEELEAAQLAVTLSPDLPLAHASLGLAYWADGQRSAALGSFIDAFVAIPRNIEAALWFASSALLMSVVALAFASFLFIAVVGLSVFPRVAHDLGDLFSKEMPGFARTALLGSIVVLPLALGEGLLGITLGLFAIGVAYGSSLHRVALGCAATTLVLVLFPVAELGGRALSMLSADPVAKSVLAVVKGVEGVQELTLLRAMEAEDALAAHGLAVHARRTGHLDEAHRRYTAVLAKSPRDPVVMNNLANLEFQRGAVDVATKLYERATAAIESPVVWFNLSQAYARSFKMDHFETALQRAQLLGPDVVAQFSEQQDPGLIADLPIDAAMLRSRMLNAADGGAFASWIRAPLAPGYVAQSWTVAAGSFGLVFLLASILGGRFDHAGKCGRCGVRICARCDGTVWNSLTCENCHRIFNQPETTDATLRAARLAELRRREASVERRIRIASLILPGVGGMCAKRPDLALLAIGFFSWSVVAFALRAGVVPDPLVVGAAGSALFMTSAVLAATMYAGLVVASLAIRRNL